MHHISEVLMRRSSFLSSPAVRWAFLGVTTSSLVQSLVGQQPTEIIQPGDAASVAYGINGTGKIAGVSCQQTCNVFTYDAGSLQNIGPDGAFSINSLGDVVGFRNFVDSTTH